MKYRPDDFFKPLSECDSDADFLSRLDESINAGTWGNLTKEQIIPYAVWDIYNPGHVRGYIECSIPPENAWKLELDAPDEHDGQYFVSQIRLISAIRDMKARTAVYEAIQKGATTPLKAIVALHAEHPEILEDDIKDIFSDAVARDILS